MSAQDFKTLCDTYYGDTVQDCVQIWRNNLGRERLIIVMFPQSSNPMRQTFRRAMHWVENQPNEAWFPMLKPTGIKNNVR